MFSLLRGDPQGPGFLDEVKEDANGDRFVKRHERISDHATTHLLTGTKGARGDPEYEEGVATDTE